MPVKTLGDVRAQGQHLYAICRHGACRYQKEIDVTRLVQSIGPTHNLVPDRSSPHFSDRMRCPSCKRRGVNLWMEPGPVRLTTTSPKTVAKQPNFKIIDAGRAPYNGREAIATADNLMVARGAYSAAALFYPDRQILLKQGTFVLEDSKDGKPIVQMSKADFDIMREAEASLSDPLRAKAS